MRLKSKKNLEFAHIYVMGLIEESTKKEEDKAEIEQRLEKAVKQIINTTTLELMGESCNMERKLQEGIQRQQSLRN